MDVWSFNYAVVNICFQFIPIKNSWKKSFMDLSDSQIKSSVEREYIFEVWNRIRIRLKFPKIPAIIKHFDVNIQDSSIYTLSKNLYHIYIIFYVGLKTFLTFPSRKSMAPSYSMFHNLIYLNI